MQKQSVYDNPKISMQKKVSACRKHVSDKKFLCQTPKETDLIVYVVCGKFQTFFVCNYM